MSDDRERWDARHRAALDVLQSPPDAWVCAALDGLGDLRGVRALDLACGTGRHALELARRGARVTGWDVSPVGLEIFRGHLRRLGLEGETGEVDLARGSLPDERFDLVVCVDFLLREIPAQVAALLEPGGVLVHRSFARDWPGERPSPRWRLAPGELEGLFPGLVVEALEESGGRAGLVARKPAARGVADGPGAGSSSQ